MATIREVAQLADVSVTTVSHVINRTRFVSEETEKRVLSAMQELNYRPNTLARSLRRGETHTIGLIVPDSANPYFAEVARLMEKQAFKAAYSTILCNSDNDLEKERSYTEVLINKQVDGIIFMACGDDILSLEELVYRQIPSIVVDRFFAQVDVDSVVSDNFQGGYLATDHLINSRHTKIAIIRGPSNINPSARRFHGYLQALQDAGMTSEPDLIKSGDFHPQSGYQAAQELLKLPEPPDAIFACNDLMAIGALHAAYEAGINVPDELSIIGYDNIELAAFTQPALTTIAQPIHSLAELSVHLLLERIDHPDCPPKHEILSNQLITRSSTRRLQ
ncbi:MAG: LacI family transcriptional regulator [Chloroflexi bacterium HGW-Chloroflexi-3]|nr:MAG: LacI family transcriptional regulator [Chloroflexi bacterium HGW-Chloroflexi-3]